MDIGEGVVLGREGWQWTEGGRQMEGGPGIPFDLSVAAVREKEVVIICKRRDNPPKFEN